MANDDGHLIRVNGRYFTDAAIAKLRKHYVGLEAEKGEVTLLDTKKLSAEDRDRIALDVEFYAQNPHTPLENMCSRLDNYEPRNESQRELARYARMLLDFGDMSRPAGLFVFGEAGVGKSHVSVALAKEFMKRGYTPGFVQFSGRCLAALDLRPQQVWILDDLNGPYGSQRSDFINVTLNAHNTGGRVFVTSNMDFDELMKGISGAIGPAETKRYLDRVKGMFKTLHVEGESHRNDEAWFK